jgi:hypothetical protein
MLNGGVSLVAGYFIERYITIGVSGGAYAFDDVKPKYEMVRAQAAYYFYGSDKSSMFLSAEPGYTAYDNENTKGDFAMDGLIDGKIFFGKSAVYIGMGYDLDSFKTGKYITKNEGFKLRFVFGI